MIVIQELFFFFNEGGERGLVWLACSAVFAWVVVTYAHTKVNTCHFNSVVCDYVYTYV